MKRVPLRRSVPLRSKHQYRPKPRAESDKVTADLFAYVMERDQSCVASQIDQTHQCIGRDSIEHVNDHATMGKRAPSDRRHCLRLCLGANLYGWASAHKNEERMYLALVEPE